MESFRSGQYLTFRIGNHELAIDAECVRGILPSHELVGADSAGLWRAGSATLHGHTFPVVDLRAKFGYRYGIQGRNPSIVVVDTGSGLAGFLADRVSEVIYVRAHEFRGGKIRIGRPREILDSRTLLLEPAIL